MFSDFQPKKGDLIRIKASSIDGMQGYLLYVTEISKTGIEVTVLSDCVHQGSSYFLPTGNRDFEVLSSYSK